jgi:hypothetical protein
MITVPMFRPLVSRSLMHVVYYYSAADVLAWMLFRGWDWIMFSSNPGKVRKR